MKMSVTTVFPVLLTFENRKSGNTVNYNLSQKSQKQQFYFWEFDFVQMHAARSNKYYQRCQIRDGRLLDFRINIQFNTE